METKLVIRQFFDRKKPCLCLEQGNQAIVVAAIRNNECKELLKEFFKGGCVAGEMRDLFEGL